jgi:4-hydroxy-tetrahydrodipicolinate reductase
MKIALIGYGKMGKEIEAIAKDRGHEIASIINHNNTNDFNSDAFKSCDVAIEFSRPETAVANYRSCFKQNVPVVSGTTGWLDQFDAITKECQEQNKGFFYASNFSIGVNIFFEINKKLAQLINPTQAYDVSMQEIHHTQKLDAPSGTAISLAEQIIENLDAKNAWELDSDKKDKLSISALRIADTPGTHGITYESEVDKITIKHEAKSRKGFALGAVLAAEFIKGKTGVYNMQDLLHL